jgi:hypothetical protein
MADQPQDEDEFPILFIQNKLQEAMKFLIHHGYRPKNTDEALGIAVYAESVGKPELAKNARRVVQYAPIVDDYSEGD